MTSSSGADTESGSNLNVPPYATFEYVTLFEDEVNSKLLKGPVPDVNLLMLSHDGSLVSASSVPPSKT